MESDERKRRLPSRNSRGLRISKLIGEEAEADVSFWDQDAWLEDAQDDDYASEAGTFWWNKKAACNYT